MRILVAEDERDMNRLISKRLAAENYSVDSCYDGVQVMEYLECAEYDGIILDIMMPRMDGIQVLKECGVKNCQIRFCSYCPGQYRGPGQWAGCRGRRLSCEAFCF